MDAMFEMQKYSCFIKCRNIHTFSSSELENMVNIHRAQDNSWTTDTFQSILFYVVPL